MLHRYNRHIITSQVAVNHLAQSETRPDAGIESAEQVEAPRGELKTCALSRT